MEWKTCSTDTTGEDGKTPLLEDVGSCTLSLRSSLLILFSSYVSHVGIILIITQGVGKGEETTTLLLLVQNNGIDTMTIDGQRYSTNFQICCFVNKPKWLLETTVSTCLRQSLNTKQISTTIDAPHSLLFTVKISSCHTCWINQYKYGALLSVFKTPGRKLEN
jgi:hypothetical protein